MCKWSKIKRKELKKSQNKSKKTMLVVIVRKCLLRNSVAGRV
jgi:hypothetical protein